METAYLASTLPLLGTIIAAIGVTVAAVVAIRGYLEFKSQNILRRFEKFLEIRRHFKENSDFRKICNLLDDNDPRLSSLPFETKKDFLGAFEDIALMNNSGLINDQIAHYMFGYYAIRCYESEFFWSDVNRESPYWKLFSSFAKKMRAIERVEINTADVSQFKF